MFFFNLPTFEVPPIISGYFSDGKVNSNSIEIEENVWKYLEGKGNFGECMEDNQTTKCTSIFNPDPNKNQ